MGTQELYLDISSEFNSSFNQSSEKNELGQEQTTSNNSHDKACGNLNQIFILKNLQGFGYTEINI